MSLVRAHLWPATPSNPRMVFTFNLLDWAEALLLECQVSVQDMCKALYFKCPYNIYKVSYIYMCPKCWFHVQHIHYIYNKF